MRPLFPLLGAFLIAIGLNGAGAAEEGAPPTIYRWIDQNGIAHYTTDPEQLPEALRAHLPERRAVENPPLSAQAPASVDAWIGQERAPEPEVAMGDASAAAGVAGGDAASTLDARIAELEAAIADDEELLKGDLTDASAPDSNETLKQVAARMPARIEELKRLRAEREALAPVPAEE
jgi:uncharacterized coiled-coil protein SlyX